MNLLWIAALAILVLFEKLVPIGRLVGRLMGLVFIVCGVWLECLPLRVVVDRGIYTMPPQLLGQRVHAERKDVHQPAQEIDVRAWLRLCRAGIGSKRDHCPNG